MPRARRLYVPGVSLHVMNRGHNRDTVFDNDVDRRVFLEAVRRASARNALEVHGFALMTNHFHLLVTPLTPLSVSRAMGAFEAAYSRYYNRKHVRIGSVWNARYLPVPVETAWQWLVCLRYIELNPVRAGLVDDPGEYPWTSYRAHALGNSTYPWLADHAALGALGQTPSDRRMIYKALCLAPLSETEMNVVRNPAAAKLAVVG